MKKTNFIFICFLFLISFKSFSQTKTEWGLKAGLNYTDYRIQTPVPAEFKGKFGFYVGGIVSFGLSDKIRLNPELLFSSQVTEYSLKLNSLNISEPNNPSSPNGYKAEIKESFILLPIMIEYMISNSFDVEIGPQIGYVISENITDNNDQFEYGTANSNNFEMGLNLGMGFRFAQNYRIGTRFIYGILERNNVKNIGFQFGLQYNF